MAKGLIWAAADDLARNRGRVLSLYCQLLKSLNSPNLPLNLAARLSKKAEVRAIFMLASEDRSLHNIEDLIDAAEYSLSLLRKDSLEGVSKMLLQMIPRSVISPVVTPSRGPLLEKVIDRRGVRSKPSIGFGFLDDVDSSICQHGYWKEGVEAFFRMCEGKIIADERTMMVVLSACAKLGDLSLGTKMHEYMCDHEVNVDVFVGNALLDMYLKCGDADFARKVFNRMPLKNVVPWNSMITGLTQQGEFKEVLNVFRRMQREGVKPDDYTLVGACRIHKKVEPRKIAVGRLVKLESERDGAYVLMSNMYSSLNRWRDALKLRKEMKGRKIKKTPGCSLIELNGVVHEFRKGDKAHPKAEEVYMLLDEMKLHLTSSNT
ncbi:hypothetical protein RJ639_046774 [Escallonia herrerae]|uniref:LYR motif containing domain-containing protein n=1 Tax=Escallonia herrerae TaxID=1293975 RepID=A0AA88W8E7_9ASTE|nr:hypothetical protein RJ639_046774 [Escallonia herrerae]